MEHSRLPLTAWVRAIHMFRYEYDDWNAAVMAPKLGISYRAALRLTRLIVRASTEGRLPEIPFTEETRPLGSPVGKTESRRSPTAKDVARLAETSTSAVSRVFSESPGVGEDTRRRVLAAADRLNYRPNLIARMLIQGATDSVGVVLADISNHFLGTVLNSLTFGLQQAGMRPILFRALDPEAAEQILPHILQYQVRAIVLTRYVASRVAVNRCRSQGVPVIFLNLDTSSPTGAICIASDQVGAGRTVGLELLKRGYRRIAYIEGPPDNPNNRDRLIGLRAVLEEHGVGLMASVPGGWSYDNGYAAASRLLLRQIKPDAIFCYNDILACGALDAARTGIGLSVPDDVAIVGFDDVPMAGWSTYQLTTMTQPVPAVTQKAVETIRDLTAGRPGRPPDQKYPCSFVPRQTTHPLVPNE